MGGAVSTASEQLAVTDALRRFAAGADEGDEALLTSAFTRHATIDFRPCGEALGLEFGLLHGREAIVAFLVGTTAKQVTVHTVGEARAEVDGDKARLSAPIDAVHHIWDGPSGMFRMMNRYDAELQRNEAGWAIERLTVTNLWSEGDAQILMNR